MDNLNTWASVENEHNLSSYGALKDLESNIVRRLITEGASVTECLTKHEKDGRPDVVQLNRICHFLPRTQLGFFKIMNKYDKITLTNVSDAYLQMMEESCLTQFDEFMAWCSIRKP